MNDSYRELWVEIKKFFTLQLDYTKLTAIEKLTIILSATAVVGVLLILGMCALFYLSFALVFIISDLIGCTWGAYLIVSGLFLIFMFVVYTMKQKLIIDPVSRFLSKLFLDPNK